jgi:hypothetical protein
MIILTPGLKHPHFHPFKEGYTKLQNAYVHSKSKGKMANLWQKIVFF